MRAWRIVQSTVFNKIYEPSRILPNKNRLGKKDEKLHYWFEPKTIVNEKNAHYYAGSYLEAMQFVLYLIALSALVPIVFAGKQAAASGLSSQALILWLGATIGFIYFCWRVIRIRSRRILLEEGLLSIHSSGILWEAVVLSYNLALKKSIKENINFHPLTKYTSNLSEIVYDTVYRTTLSINSELVLYDLTDSTTLAKASKKLKHSNSYTKKDNEPSRNVFSLILSALDSLGELLGDESGKYPAVDKNLVEMKFTNYVYAFLKNINKK